MMRLSERSVPSSCVDTQDWSSVWSWCVHTYLVRVLVEASQGILCRRQASVPQLCDDVNARSRQHQRQVRSSATQQRMHACKLGEGDLDGAVARRREEVPFVVLAPRAVVQAILTVVTSERKEPVGDG
jgi:hypothetical protein